MYELSAGLVLSKHYKIYTQFYPAINIIIRLFQFEAKIEQKTVCIQIVWKVV